MIDKAGRTGVFCLDPRTKILLIFILVFASMCAPSLKYDLLLVSVTAVLCVLSGKWKYALKGTIFYILVYAFTGWAMVSITGTMRTSFVAFLGLFHKVYPCGFLSGLILSTTKVNEFLSAMQKIHMPKSLVISIAVMLRYVPAIREDWGYIKDAMKMRDVSPSIQSFLRNPGMTVECIYVPLMMAASKTSDELSAACVTRGIENPKQRTCLTVIRFGIMDIIVPLIFIGILVLELYGKGGMN